MNTNTNSSGSHHEAHHPIWTVLLVLVVGGIILGTLALTTSKWDSEVLIAITAIAGPFIVDYFRRRYGLEETENLRNKIKELEAVLRKRDLPSDN